MTVVEGTAAQGSCKKHERQKVLWKGVTKETHIHESAIPLHSVTTRVSFRVGFILHPGLHASSELLVAENVA